MFFNLVFYWDLGFKFDLLLLWVLLVIVFLVLFWWGVFCVWILDLDFICLGDVVGIWGLVFLLLMCIFLLGLVFCVFFDIVFLRVFWMVFLMFVFRFFRVEVFGFDGVLFGCLGRDKGNFFLGWVCCKLNRYGKL